MATRVGINGFGRMGRLALRAGWTRSDLQFTHINEVSGGPATAAHLLTFDSVHGRWDRHIDVAPDALSVDGRSVAFSAIPSPGAVPWSESGVDVVLECSGKFRTPERLEAYFAAGVKTVIVAAPVKTCALNIVMGVNDHLYDPQVASSPDRRILHDQLPRAGGKGRSTRRLASGTASSRPFTTSPIRRSSSMRRTRTCAERAPAACRSFRRARGRRPRLG